MAIIVDKTSYTSPQVQSDPFTHFNELREAAPIHWNERHRAWVLTRFADVREWLRDPRMSVDRVRPYFQKRVPAQQQDELRETFDLLARWLPFLDPPRHTDLRGVIQNAFTPKVIRNQHERITAIVDQVVDDTVARLLSEGSIDLVPALAQRIPAQVMTSMLHLDPDDYGRIHDWTEGLSLFIAGAVDEPDRNARIHDGVSQMASYVDRAITQSGSDPDSDIIAALLAAEDGGTRLTHDEVIATGVLLVFAGYRTTASSIANALRLVIDRAEVREGLEREPGLVPSAVEEFMRFEGHSRVLVRWAREDLEIAGQSISAGDRFFFLTAAANRDPRQFENPDELILDRTPNPHLGFGYGIHYCLGAPLARVEQQETIHAFVERFPVVAVDEIEWENVVTNRALTRLIVSTTSGI